MSKQSSIDNSRFWFEGGVNAYVEYSGNEELIPFGDREIRRATRAWRDRLDNSDGRGGMLTAHHQRDALDRFPKPLNYLVAQIIAQNEEVWLRSGKHDTYGAECVREQGLTNNQWDWIETVAGWLDEESEYGTGAD